jgi:hypothetical protein
MPGLALETIHSDFAFVGRVFVDSEDAKFEKASFSFSQLAEWFSFSGIAIKPEIAPDGTGAGMDLSYRFPQTLSCRAGGAKIATSFTFSAKSEQVPRAVSVQEFASLQVEDFGKATGREVNTRYFSPLLTLLMFASGATSELQKYELTGYAHGTDDPVEVNCLFSPPRTETKPSKTLMGFEFLFTLRDVADRFESFMQSWFAFEQKHKDFSTLFFSYDYSKHSFLETRFIFLMLAVQNFVRDEFGESTTVKDFDSLRADFLSQSLLRQQPQSSLVVPTEVELGLPTLLSDFLAKEWNIVEKVVGTTEEQFVEMLIATRHYVTHRGTKGSNVAGGARLYWLTERLSACMKLTLLRILGFSDEQIVDKRDNYSLFNHLATITSPWDDSAESE